MKVRTKETAVQRIQVGVVGLVVVLLFVSLANMVNERAAETEIAAGTPANLEEVAEAVPEEEVVDEPLAEFGVAPVAESEADEKAKAEAEALEAAPEQNNVEATDQATEEATAE